VLDSRSAACAPADPERSAVTGEWAAAHISRICKIAGVPDLNYTAEHKAARRAVIKGLPALLATPATARPASGEVVFMHR
jgi:hypothetical protein